MTLIIAIGSKSAIKSAATREACLAVGIAATLVERAAPSGVPTQPVGREETARGARNRARAARDAVPGSWGVGIENGIVREDGRWQDVAAVVIIAPDGRETVGWSDAVTFPDALVERARDIGFDRVTVGSLIAEQLGCPADDPHSALTEGRQTRADILTHAVAEAFVAALRQDSPKGDRVMKTTHRVEIGGVVRDLPVREVAPGVRVALFNILGDWLLAEAAGKALAAKLPRGLTALVMPDGKATALLHVLGRMTGLPTFVARKEKKPYMAEPVRAYTYRSITTNREQALYIGAEDADGLAGKRVIIVDDVVSTGGTIEAMKALMAEVGADVAGVAAIFTEGDERPDVISLGNLPLF
jgi:adenine phosphoribosyltransferase